MLYNTTGAVMAKLIHTGTHEAIDLKGLRGEQVLTLDKAVIESSTVNDGDAFWLIYIRGGVLEFLRSLVTSKFYPLKPRKR